MVGQRDPLWHSAIVGEIFHIDGVLRKEVYCWIAHVGDGICFSYD